MTDDDLSGFELIEADEARAEQNEEIVETALVVAGRCQEMFGDNAERFTCTEIEALVQFYFALGQPYIGCQLLLSHAAGDREIEEDAHVGLSTIEEVAYYFGIEVPA